MSNRYPTTPMSSHNNQSNGAAGHAAMPINYFQSAAQRNQENNNSVDRVSSHRYSPLNIVDFQQSQTSSQSTPVSSSSPAPQSLPINDNQQLALQQQQQHPKSLTERRQTFYPPNGMLVPQSFSNVDFMRDYDELYRNTEAAVGMKNMHVVRDVITTLEELENEKGAIGLMQHNVVVKNYPQFITVVSNKFCGTIDETYHIAIKALNVKYNWFPIQTTEYNTKTRNFLVYIKTIQSQTILIDGGGMNSNNINPGTIKREALDAPPLDNELRETKHKRRGPSGAGTASTHRRRSNRHDELRHKDIKEERRDKKQKDEDDGSSSNAPGLMRKITSTIFGL